MTGIYQPLHVPWVRPPLPFSWRPFPGSSRVSWNSHDAETVLFWPHAVWRIAGPGPPRRWTGPVSPTRIKQHYARILSVAAVWGKNEQHIKENGITDVQINYILTK